METFDTFLALKVAYLVFSSAEQLSINLQGVDITVQEALQGADLLSIHLKSLCTASALDSFYRSVCKESENLTEEQTLPRAR